MSEFDVGVEIGLLIGEAAHWEIAFEHRVSLEAAHRVPDAMRAIGREFHFGERDEEHVSVNVYSVVGSPYLPYAYLEEVA